MTIHRIILVIVGVAATIICIGSLYLFGYKPDEKIVEITAETASEDKGVTLEFQTNSAPALPLPESRDMSKEDPPIQVQSELQVDESKRAADVQVAAQNIRNLIEARADVGQVAQAIRELKSVAGNQGVPGVNLDAAIEGIDLAQAMQRKGAELDVLMKKVRSDPQAVPKEELDRLISEITQLQERLLKIEVLK